MPFRRGRAALQAALAAFSRLASRARGRACACDDATRVYGWSCAGVCSCAGSYTGAARCARTFPRGFGEGKPGHVVRTSRPAGCRRRPRSPAERAVCESRPPGLPQRGGIHRQVRRNRAQRCRRFRRWGRGRRGLPRSFRSPNQCEANPAEDDEHAADNGAYRTDDAKDMTCRGEH